MKKFYAKVSKQTNAKCVRVPHKNEHEWNVGETVKVVSVEEEDE